MFEQTFKNIDDVLWKEAGCTTELDYTEQTSWLLFLKYLDDLEQERALEAELVGKPYEFIIDEAHRWSAWAAPKKADGTLDHDNALIGDDLIDYVNRQLFHIYRDSSRGLLVQTQSNTRLGKFLARLRIGFKAATACGMRWNISMSYGLDRNRRNTSYRISMKPKSKTWAMRGAMGVSITRRVLDSGDDSGGEAEDWRSHL
jgi:type I restriction enzyme M protein